MSACTETIMLSRMFTMSVLLALAATAFGFAQRQAGVARHVDNDQGWAVKHPDTWKVNGGADAYTTVIEAPADEQIDIFIETFSVMARKQDGPVTLKAATEAVKEQFNLVGAELLEEQQTNIRLAGQPAARLIWKLQLAGVDLRLAQLMTVVGDTVYLCTFTVEATKAQKFERLAHDMFNSFELVTPVKSKPTP